VLTDIMMPFVDGVALARALRKMNPGIRIIASTGQAEKSRQTELRSHGIDLFLNKPYTSKQLLQTITKRLRDARMTND